MSTIAERNPILRPYADQCRSGMLMPSWPEMRAAPEVIDSSYGENSEEHGSELAYLPSERPKPGDTEVTVELRRTNDNRLAVLAYSSLESLVECCGELQPWVSLPAEKVTEVAGDSQADVVLWDAAFPPRSAATRSSRRVTDGVPYRS